MALTIAINTTVAAVTSYIGATAAVSAGTLAAAAVTKTVVTHTLLAAAAATVDWWVQEYLNDDDTAEGGSGIPSREQTAQAGGASAALHVLGRARLTQRDFLPVYISRVDHATGGPNVTSQLLNVFHVLSEGPCEGVEKVWIDSYLAMEAPATGTNSADGTPQFLEPTQMTDDPDDEDGPQIGWWEVYDQNIAGGDTVDDAIRDLRLHDQIRYRKIQEVHRRNGGDVTPNTRFARANGMGREDDGLLDDHGSWCRCWVYPNGMDKTYFESQYGTSHMDDDDDFNPDDRRFEAIGSTEALFQGKCVVHMQLERSSGFSDDPFGGRIPNIEYQVKGRRISWPQANGTLNSPTWTENAAAIRYWFHRTLEEIPDDKIDRAEFLTAYNKCEETVDFTTLAGYNADTYKDFSTSVKRYTINGVFLQDPKLYDQYRRDMDQAWQGNVIDSRSKLLFRPGFTRPITLNIGPHNIVETGQFIPQPAINNRINAAKTVIQQSLDHEFEPVDLDPVIDTEGERKDGRYLERQIQGLRFVKYPLIATNILHTFLRRNRASARLTLTLQIDPTDFDGNTVARPNCLDRASVTVPSLGLENAPYEIQTWKRNEDWTVTVTLRESPNGIYTDTLEVPPRIKRRLNIPDITTPPPTPTGLVATPKVDVLPDGAIRTALSIGWDSSGSPIEVEINNDDGTYSDSHVAGAGVAGTEVAVPEADTYIVSIRAVNEHGRQSPPVETTVTVSTAGLKPPAPSLNRSELRANDMTLFFNPLPATNYDVSGIDFRYRVRDLDSTTAFPADPTEAQWASLNRLAGDPVVSSLAEYSVSLQIPFAGRYQIFARSVTRQGLVSDIVNLGEYLLAGARPSTGSEDFGPQWIGTRSGIGQLWSDAYTDDDGTARDIMDALVADRPDASALTFDDFDGRNGWPFGKETAATFTINPAEEFEAIGNYGVRYVLGTWTPNNTTPDVDVHFQGMVNGTPVGQNVNAGDGTTFTRLNNINELQVTITINSRDTAIYGFRLLWNTRV